jgi:hypothetical protein
MGAGSVSGTYSDEFLERLNTVTAKRPRTVIQHILEHGHITSQELKDIYGYNHPPRAVRDVREHGIPIETYRTEGTDGRKIAAYRFGNPAVAEKRLSKSTGRTVLSKALKQALIEKYGAKCFIYFEAMDEHVLQVDHRIPYEIAGAQDESNIDAFMLLSPSANRTKSWTCEYCANWELKAASYCLKCFWAYPEEYERVADVRQKIITIIFTGGEIEDFDRLIEMSGADGAQEMIKSIVHEYLENRLTNGGKGKS